MEKYCSKGVLVSDVDLAVVDPKKKAEVPPEVYTLASHAGRFLIERRYGSADVYVVDKNFNEESVAL